MTGASGDDDFDQGATVIGVSFDEQIAAAHAREQEQAKSAEAASPNPSADPFGATAIAPSYDERLAAMGVERESEPPEAPTEVSSLSYDERLKQMEGDDSPKTQVLPEMGGAALPPAAVAQPPSAAPGPAPPPPALVGAPAPPPLAPGISPPGPPPAAAGVAPSAPGAPPQPSWGVARTMAIEGLAAQGLTPPPGGALAPQAAPQPYAAPPAYAPPPAAAPKKGLSPVVMMLIGAGAVFFVGALLMAVVVGIFMLRG